MLSQGTGELTGAEEGIRKHTEEIREPHCEMQVGVDSRTEYTYLGISAHDSNGTGISGEAVLLYAGCKGSIITGRQVPVAGRTFYIESDM
jgi:hypothetical protein